MARKPGKLVKKEDKAYLSNVLNEMVYEEKMTLSELRFFLVYLSKLNPNTPDETEITFSLEEYANILGVEQNEALVSKITRKLLRYVVCVRPKVLDDDVLEDYTYCQIFSKSRFYKRKKDDKWYLTFSCHEDVKPQLFELKGEFTNFEVWNIINLRSFQDARMYMLLKQYKTIGARTIDIIEIKKMLGMSIDSYPSYPFFARDVLKKSQKSLKKYTDIEFEFRAVGRPARAVHFVIKDNKSYTPPAFLSNSSESDVSTAPSAAPALPSASDPSAAEENIDIKKRLAQVMEPLHRACNNEFSNSQMQVIIDTLDQYLPDAALSTMADILSRAYHELEVRAAEQPVKNRVAYLKGIIKNMFA